MTGKSEGDEYMIEMIITSSVLILVILILRRIVGRKINMQLRYALWLLVAVRLILPVNVGSSGVSVLNLLPHIQQSSDSDTEELPTDKTADAEYSEDGGKGSFLTEPLPLGEEKENENVSEPGAVLAADTEAALVSGTTVDALTGETEPERGMRDIYRGVLTAIWFAGILLVGGYMTLAQIRFVKYLRRNREAVPMQCLPKEWTVRLSEHNMKVYQIKGLPSPCLAGRCIYIDKKMCRETDRLPHILAHEYCHARQYDTLWAILRSVLTAVYWFHPLVWAAAYGAKQDSELACDAAAIRLLGEAKRYEYGRTLLYLLKGGSNKIGYAGMVLTMDGRESGIRERVSMIAESHGRKKWVAAVVGMIMCVSCGCAFTGAKEAGQTEESRIADGETAQAQTEETLPEEETERIEKETETGLGEKQVEASEDETFQKLLYLTEAEVIWQNKEIDLQAYAEYSLGITEECPLVDGTWYLLQKDASGIVLYGLYTEEYGCYGIGTLIDGDMNFFMEEWLPGYMVNTIKVLEWTESGLPRTFAFTIRQTNTRTSEIWKLYVADRYDTGHVELYTFPATAYQKQLEDMMEFSIQQDSGQIMIVCEGDMVVGEIDVSAFEDYVIEDVVWEGDPLAFRLEDTFPVGDIDSQSETSVNQEGTEEPIMMVTGIGLKLQGIDELWYYGLPVLVFPIDTGEWGEHEMILGTPSIGQTNYVIKPQTVLPDVEEKMGITPIHLTESED